MRNEDDRSLLGLFVKKERERKVSSEVLSTPLIHDRNLLPAQLSSLSSDLRGLWQSYRLLAGFY